MSLLLLAVSTLRICTAAYAMQYITIMSNCVIWSDEVHIHATVACRGPTLSVDLRVLRPFQRLLMDINVTANRDLSGRHNSHNVDNSYTLHSQLDYCEILSGIVGHPLIMLIYVSMQRTKNSQMISACPVQKVICNLIWYLFEIIIISVFFCVFCA